MKETILFLGPPGSGKGTQAGHLARDFGILHLSMGRFMRDNKDKYPELFKIMNEGGLVPDNKLFELLTNYLKEVKPEGLVLDGTPRSLEQYELIKPWLEDFGLPITTAIYLNISENEAVKRLANRVKDPVTGFVYNTVTNPPPEDIDKSRLIHREDDSPKTIKERFETYHKLTEPVLKKLEEDGILYEINGERGIDEIYTDIINVFTK